MEDKGNFHKPNEELSSWQKFKRLVWNSETGEFFGRTGVSWFKIILFYIIFYACLAAFWTCMLVIFYETLPEDQPKWSLDGSRIGTSPGLGFRPSPPESNVDSTLIWYNATKNETVNYWVDSLNQFQKVYMSKQMGKGIKQCGDHQYTNKKTVCHFEVITEHETSSCIPGRQFGFAEGKPCILIKLNRIYGWKPEPYDSAPEELKKLLVEPEFDADYVYITCIGENSADRDNIGKVEYFPSQAIHRRFFPFLNQPNYVSPYVFAQFSNIARGVLVNIECRAWADNIVFDRGDRLGSVHFELLID